MFTKVFGVELLLILTLTSTGACSWLGDGFLSWFWQGAVVANGWLYIDGGEIWTSTTNPSTDPSNNQTFAINLNNSWTADTVQVIVNNKSSDNPPLKVPGLWYDSISDEILSYGGRAYVPTNVSAWGFKPDGKGNAVWSREYTQDDSSSFRDLTRPAFAMTAKTSEGFSSFGGFIYKYTDARLNSLDQGFALNSWTSYASSTSTWSNFTSPGSSTRFSGQAQFIDTYGDAGIVVFIGGSQTQGQGFVPQRSLFPMDKITVYDIKTNKFYNQAATGAIPDQIPKKRENFCSVVATSPDKGTYEIFIFGGSDPLANDASLTDFGRVYVLSLPAFVWTQLPNSRVPWRKWHTCQKIGNRTMISIGGTQESENFKTPDIWKNGLGLFDMVSGKWVDRYDASAPAYERPVEVLNNYNKGSNNASAFYPSTWTDPALRSIFKADGPLPVLYSSIGNSSQSGSQTRARKSNHAGAIAGGVVGGVAALLALALLLLYWRRKRPREERSLEKPHPYFSDLPTEETYKGISRPAELEVQPAELETVQLPSELPTGANGNEYKPQVHT